MENFYQRINIFEVIVKGFKSTAINVLTELKIYDILKSKI